jgi:hypothetical protein
MKTSIWTAATSAILVGIVVAWMNFNSASASRSALAAALVKRAALAQEINRTRERIATSERTLADLDAALKTARAEAEKQAAAASSAKAGAVPPPPRWRIIEAHPELRPLFRQNFRATMRLGNYYPWFYRASGLTPEQIQKFEALMIENEEQKMDLQATAQAQNPGRSVIAAMKQQMDEKLQAAQMELLGAAGYQQLQDFERAKHQNALVGEVVAQVALTSAPFTEAQREQLSKVLVTSVRSDANVPFDPKERSYIALSKITDWPRVMAQAQTFLSPAQLSALKGQAANVEAWALIREFCVREGIPAGK